jgi:hypothetical protein
MTNARAAPCFIWASAFVIDSDCPAAPAEKNGFRILAFFA